MWIKGCNSRPQTCINTSYQASAAGARSQQAGKQFSSNLALV
jgi:hypothetical protein